MKDKVITQVNIIGKKVYDITHVHLKKKENKNQRAPY